MQIDCYARLAEQVIGAVGQAGESDELRSERLFQPSPSDPDNLIAAFPAVRGGIVKTVTLDVRPPSDAVADFRQAWKSGKRNRSAHISFAAPELLWQVLTARRWALLKALCGAGPLSIREAARQVKRDVKAVHGDITALLSAGVLSRTEAGEVEFPFEAVKVEFLLHAA